MANSSKWRDAAQDVKQMGINTWQGGRRNLARLGATKVGGAFGRGVGETFGWQYGSSGLTKNLSHGFLGLNKMGRRALKRDFSKHSGELIRKGVARGTLKYGASMGFKAAGAVVQRALFPVFTVYSIYSGYQEGGVWGAAKNLATDPATWGGVKVTWAAIGGTAGVTALGIGAVAAAGAYGGYKLGEAGRAHLKSLKKLELQTSNVEAFDDRNAYTMRQRALQALQNTHLNGRSALGQEALLMH